MGLVQTAGSEQTLQDQRQTLMEAGASKQQKELKSLCPNTKAAQGSRSFEHNWFQQEFQSLIRTFVVFLEDLLKTKQILWFSGY